MKNPNDELLALQEKHRREEQELKDKAKAAEEALREKAAEQVRQKNLAIKNKLAKALLDADTEGLLTLREPSVEKTKLSGHINDRIVLEWTIPGKDYPELVEVKFHDTSDTWSRQRSGEYKYRFEYDFKGKWIKKPATVIRNIKETLEIEAAKNKRKNEKQTALRLGVEHFSKMDGVIKVEAKEGYDSKWRGAPDRVIVTTKKGDITYSVGLLKGELSYNFRELELNEDVRDELIDFMLN